MYGEVDDSVWKNSLERLGNIIIVGGGYVWGSL